MTPNSLELDSNITHELNTLLDGVPIGSAFQVDPSADLLYLLELYIPRLLSLRYPKWEGESLDGFFLVHTRKIGIETAELAGLCILISDQTLTPVLIRLSLSSSRDSIATYEVLLGEAGGGRLGISGPTCNSWRAQKLLDNIGGRLNDIRWSYTIASDETNWRRHI
jgi:hypothetical protein